MNFLLLSQAAYGQALNGISIISTDITYLRTEVTKSSTRHVPGSKYVQYVITDHTNDYYLLKFSIKINDNIESPLDLKLTPKKRNPRVFRIEDKLGNMENNKIYDYELEYGLNDTGWVLFELGNFSDLENQNSINKIFDKTSIYISK